jgi:hypothetical protein
MAEPELSPEARQRFICWHATSKLTEAGVVVTAALGVDVDQPWEDGEPPEATIPMLVVAIPETVTMDKRLAGYLLLLVQNPHLALESTRNGSDPPD